MSQPERGHSREKRLHRSSQRPLQSSRLHARHAPPTPWKLGLRWTLRLLVKLRLLWIILIAFLFLSGCVRYDVGLMMAANPGEFGQQIRLSEHIPVSGSHS